MNKLIQFTKIALLTIILAEEVRKAKKPKYKYSDSTGRVYTGPSVKCPT